MQIKFQKIPDAYPPWKDKEDGEDRDDEDETEDGDDADGTDGARMDPLQKSVLDCSRSHLPAHQKINKKNRIHLSRCL